MAKIISDAEKKRILKLHNQGFGTAEIVRKTGRSHQSVRKIIGAQSVKKAKIKNKEDGGVMRMGLIAMICLGVFTDFISDALQSAVSLLSRLI